MAILLDLLLYVVNSGEVFEFRIYFGASSEPAAAEEGTAKYQMMNHNYKLKKVNE